VKRFLPLPGERAAHADFVAACLKEEREAVQSGICWRNGFFLRKRYNGFRALLLLLLNRLKKGVYGNRPFLPQKLDRFCAENWRKNPPSLKMLQSIPMRETFFSFRFFRLMSLSFAVVGQVACFSVWG
jgi:hypothetical protein